MEKQAQDQQPAFGGGETDPAAQPGPQAPFNLHTTCRSVPVLYCSVADKDAVLLPNPSFPSRLALFSFTLTFFASSVQAV